MSTLLDFSASTATGLGGETLSGQQIVDALTASRPTKTIVNPGNNIDLNFVRNDIVYRILVSSDIVVNIQNGDTKNYQNMRLIFQIPFGNTPKISFGNELVFSNMIDLANYASSGVLCIDVQWDGISQTLNAAIISDTASSVVPKNQDILGLSPDIWLDAGVGITFQGGGDVSSWNSKTGNVSVSAGTGSVTLLSNALNGHPALHFSGNAALKFSYLNTPGTIIAVYRNTVSTSSPQPAIAAYDSVLAGTPAWALRGYIPMGVSGAYARAQGYQVGTSNSGTEFAGRVSGALGHWQVLGGTYSNDTVTAASGNVHSIPCIKSPLASILAPGGKLGAIGATYNSSGNFTDFFTGDLCELLVWERALTQREYNAVVSALQDKYSLKPVFGRFLYGAFQTTQSGSETGGVEGLVALSSDDGIEWQHIPTELIFDNQHTMRDPSLTFYNGEFLIACTAGSFGSGYQDRFSVYKSTDFRHWEFVTDVQCVVGGVSSHQTWAPEWFHNPADGVLRLVVHLSIGSAYNQVYEMHPTDDKLQTWSDPVLISLTGYSNVIDSFPFYYKDRWVLFFKDENTHEIQIATAASPTGPYTVITSGDWAGWGVGVEGPSVMPLGEDASGNSMFRVYIDAQGNGISYTDAVGAWPDVLTGKWSTPKLLTVPSNPQHGTCIRNPMPNFGT